MELAALRPYLRGNPVHFLRLIDEQKGWVRANLVQTLSPLSCYSIHGDQTLVDRAWPKSIEHLRRPFPLRCTLPKHVIPVYADHGHGCVVPFHCEPAEEWDASDACARFEPNNEQEPLRGLMRLIHRITEAWRRRTGEILPLRWRVAYALNISIPVHAGDIEGRSMQLPLMVALIREAAASMTGEMPWGSNPVFCSGPVPESGIIEPAKRVTAKLRGFIREFGPGRVAILSKAQMDTVYAEDAPLLDRVHAHPVTTLEDILGLPQVVEAMRTLAGPPRLTEIDHLTRLMTRLARGIRFQDALAIGEYLVPHVESDPYKVRVHCAVAHLLLHQGKIRESARHLDQAGEIVNSRARLGADARAHYAAIRGIHLLDAGDPDDALAVLNNAKLGACSHLTRIEVSGTRSQALRAAGDHRGAIRAALRATVLAKDGLASEAGRDFNYAVHALIRQAESERNEQRRGKILDRACEYLEESIGAWSPMEPERRTVHRLFCRHHRAEIDRLRGKPTDPGAPPDDVRDGWRHPWLFTLLSCSRNPANSLEDRRSFAKRLVSDSGSIIEYDGSRAIFRLFHLIYRIWCAALHEEDESIDCANALDWCEQMAEAGLPGWKRRLEQMLLEPCRSAEECQDRASRLCSSIYFH